MNENNSNGILKNSTARPASPMPAPAQPPTHCMTTGKSAKSPPRN